MDSTKIGACLSHLQGNGARLMSNISLFVDNHLDEIDRYVADFTRKVKQDIAAAGLALKGVLNELVVREDVIQTSPTLAATLMLIPTTFASEVRKSGYYVHTHDFVQNFDSQIDSALEAMVLFGVAGAFLNSEQRDFLVSQKLTAKLVLDMEPLLITARLSQLIASVSAGQRFSEVVDYILQAVTRLEEVAQKAQLLITSFFRKTLAAFYVNEEKIRGARLYSYVGPADSKNRKFCAGIIAGGRTYSLADIELMDNGQIPGVLENCGGFACRHWWALATPISELV